MGAPMAQGKAGHSHAGAGDESRGRALGRAGPSLRLNARHSLGLGSLGLGVGLCGSVGLSSCCFWSFFCAW